MTYLYGKNVETAAVMTNDSWKAAHGAMANLPALITPGSDWNVVKGVTNKINAVHEKGAELDAKAVY